MFPCFVRSNFGDGTLSYAKSIGPDGQGFFGVPDYSDQIRCETGIVVILSESTDKDLPAQVVSIFGVLTSCHILQIAQGVVKRVAVLVMNFKPFWARSKESKGYKSMDRERRFLIGPRQTYLEPVLGSSRWGKDDASNTPYTTKRRNFIESFVVRNSTPFFHTAIIAEGSV